MPAAGGWCQRGRRGGGSRRTGAHTRRATRRRPAVRGARAGQGRGRGGGPRGRRSIWWRSGGEHQTKRHLPSLSLRSQLPPATSPVSRADERAGLLGNAAPRPASGRTAGRDRSGRTIIPLGAAMGQPGPPTAFPRLPGLPFTDAMPTIRCTCARCSSSSRRKCATSARLTVRRAPRGIRSSETP